MVDSRQQAYLDAMGIRVWLLRDTGSQALPADDEIPGLKLGPGTGGVLLICAADSDSASRLANDISRSLSSVPVWAWPDSAAGTVKLADAVSEHLFITVAIFGAKLAGQLFGRELPTNLETAKLLQLPEMRELESLPEARRSLWEDLCRSGMVATD